MTDAARVFGDLNESEFIVPLSFRMSLFEVLLLPWTVTLPAMVVAPIFAVPVVLIIVLPLITEAPLIVPVVMTGLVIVLLVKVWLPTSVMMTPVVGKVALEFTPLPPSEVGRMPVTAAV